MIRTCTKCQHEAREKVIFQGTIYQCRKEEILRPFNLQKLNGCSSLAVQQNIEKNVT